MYRQYSNRNPRNRGIKVKHALQICFILAVFFWLIYQVKHSHDKTKELEENDAKGSPGRGSSGGLIKIRRKVFVPLYEETVTENKQHNEATEEEISEESRDKYEVEKFDAEVDKEEGKMTDEAQEDVIDSEIIGEISDDGNDRKQENFVDDSGRDGGNKSNHKAREKFYEPDDASAVTHANHTRTTENEKEVVAISLQRQENILEQENKDNHTEEAKNGKIKKRLEVDGGEISDDANPSSTTATAINVTTSGTKGRHSDSSKKGSSQNNTLSEAPNNNLETSNSTTDVTKQNPKLSEQNVSESVPELYHDEGIVTEGTSTKGSNLETIGLQQANNFTLAVENHLSNSNSSGHTESKNSDSNDTGSFTLVKMTRSEHSLQDGTNTQKNETVSDSANSRDRKYLSADLDTVPPLDTE